MSDKAYKDPEQILAEAEVTSTKEATDPTVSPYTAEAATLDPT